MKKEVKLDGFRKGQVPYDIYVKKAGIESLYMDAIDMAVDTLYAKLLSDPKTITPAATPAIDIKNITDKEVEIEFTLVGTPEVKLGKYKDLGIKKEKVEVSKEDSELLGINPPMRDSGDLENSDSVWIEGPNGKIYKENCY